ncbi:hypothetical protein M3P36_03635 [Altererythrobacter sp. KTW20L]|uniref:hypothetical protein n=1 Tax=Altererythrobacter sp. KTW20L TaxID=2942210 RepID=UPI0020C0419C|nr:hypothetical protein [Altererythrobacter sp. KTW20L]MCL6250139.1 hypothetical protein [Altererythrobacter sp. KTW20L]
MNFFAIAQFSNRPICPLKRRAPLSLPPGRPAILEQIQMRTFVTTVFASIASLAISATMLNAIII